MRSGRAHSRFTIGFRVHVLLLVQQSWFPIFFFDNLGSPSQDLGSTWHETKPNQGAHGMSSLKRIHFIIDLSFIYVGVYFLPGQATARSSRLVMEKPLICARTYS